MRKQLLSFLVVPLITFPGDLVAQCGAGEVEVTIAISTDDYGYETYWQLTPTGSPCGTGTIEAGGNLTIGCSGGGAQVQEMSGYGNNTVVTAGPWCLLEGTSYTIHSVDDWGDNHASYEVFVGGVSVAVFPSGTGNTLAHVFIAQLPQARDMSITELTTPLYDRTGDAVAVSGTLKSLGAETVTSFDLNYAIDGGTPTVQTFIGQNIQAGESLEFIHNTPWSPTEIGTYGLDVWITNINGAEDMVPVNDHAFATLTVNAAIPNIIDAILGSAYTVTQIANSDQDLLVPRDLDFHPDLARNELWVINKDTEESGGSTVKFSGLGETGGSHLMQEDPNNWHFMSLPTGIAFANNGNFATCPGVFDANHNGGTPFTGPSLWSSDPAIYAQNLFGPLGSHLDMLHVTPNSQGIAAENWNRFWVVDGFNGDVVMHDFRGDHGPGQDYHGNAIIRRYDEVQITRDPNDHIVSHCALDKTTGWLYVVDHGGQRVYRLNINTGNVSGPGDYGPWETYVEYSMVTGYSHEVIITSGLEQPAGIEVIGDRLLVSDHASGDIVVYDLSASTVPEIGRIITNSPGIMGITVGPDGRIWFVNASTHQLMVVGEGPVGMSDHHAANWNLSPTVTSDVVTLTGSAPFKGNEPVLVIDPVGRVVFRTSVDTARNGLDMSALLPGAYTIRIGGEPRRVVVQR